MTNQPTTVFRLPSGPECEVKELTGKHQRLMTEQAKKTHIQRLTDVLKDVVVRVGSRTDLDDAFFENLLAPDRKAMLAVTRQFTFDFEKVFHLRYPYTDQKGVKQVHEMEIPTEDGMFPVSPMMVDGGESLVPATFEEYEDVLNSKDVFITLPSGLQVRYTQLDGKGELIGSSTKKNERSSHTILKMRRPVYFEDKGTGSKVAISLNLDKLSYKDITALRKSIQEREGRVDTEVSFEHPEADFMAPDERTVIMDVMGTTDFFFPAGVI